MCEQGEDKIDVNELLKIEKSVKIHDWKISYSITNTNIIIDEKWNPPFDFESKIPNEVFCK